MLFNKIRNLFKACTFIVEHGQGTTIHFGRVIQFGPFLHGRRQKTERVFKRKTVVIMLFPFLIGFADKQISQNAQATEFAVFIERTLPLFVFTRAQSIDPDLLDGGIHGDGRNGNWERESAVNAIVEILLGLPLLVKEAIASGVKLQFSDALPAISFPANGAIRTKILSDAIATMLSLAVSFKLGDVGAFAVTFVGAVHGH